MIVSQPVAQAATPVAMIIMRSVGRRRATKKNRRIVWITYSQFVFSGTMKASRAEMIMPGKSCDIGRAAVVTAVYAVKARSCRWWVSRYVLRFPAGILLIKAESMDLPFSAVVSFMASNRASASRMKASGRVNILLKARIARVMRSVACLRRFIHFLV